MITGLEGSQLIDSVFRIRRVEKLKSFFFSFMKEGMVRGFQKFRGTNAVNKTVELAPAVDSERLSRIQPVKVGYARRFYRFPKRGTPAEVGRSTALPF